MRDSCTMAATFWAAPIVSQYLQTERQWSKNHANVSSALSVPVLAQVLTAPCHVNALHLYNAPYASFTQQWQQIGKEFGKVSLARSLRVLPAFGIGSFSNNMTIGERIQRRVTQMEESIVLMHSIDIDNGNNNKIKVTATSSLSSSSRD